MATSSTFGSRDFWEKAVAVLTLLVVFNKLPKKYGKPLAFATLYFALTA